jgi:catechol 2,3-dioxygenase-like lactoylglutathione lyase family enzyme
VPCYDVVVTIESLNALTLAVSDMARAVTFYRAVGFVLKYGGPDASFTSFRLGSDHLNLFVSPTPPTPGWGRAIFYVDDVDAQYRRVIAAGLSAQAPPRDAPWGERFFHVVDPDGHELSFAKPLPGNADSA